MSAARADRRRLAAALTLAAVLAGGAAIHGFGPSAVVSATGDDDLRGHFDAAVRLLQTHDAVRAEAAWRELLEHAPALPEARVNHGFALLELGRADAARVAFERATTLRPAQANAYYGLALAHEAAGDYAAALGAMRSYLHLEANADAAIQRRARAALWEWEAKVRQGSAGR